MSLKAPYKNLLRGSRDESEIRSVGHGHWHGPFADNKGNGCILIRALSVLTYDTRKEIYDMLLRVWWSGKNTGKMIWRTALFDIVQDTVNGLSDIILLR